MLKFGCIINILGANMGLLTINLVTWQCRLGDSLNPRPNTRILAQSEARTSQRPPFSKPVISKACSARVR